MMLKKIYTLVVVVLTLTSSNLLAQQMPLYSQYMFNHFLINPATAGLDGYTSVNLTAREQWVGLAGAPSTYSVSGQTRLLNGAFLFSKAAVRKTSSRASRDSRVGLGANIYNDHNGLINRAGLQLTYAYHLPMDEAELSFGLTGSFYQFSINKNKMELLDQDDDLINQSDLSMILPDLNFGVFYTAKDYYAGVSVAQLLQSSIQFGNSGYEEYRMYRHYFITGGYKFVLDRDYMLEPSTLIKISKQGRPQIDLGTKLYIRNDYWAGLSFRTGSAFVLMGGLTVDKYSFGYAFDYTLNSIRKNTFGSHEFMIAVKFGDSARRFRWLKNSRS